MTARARIGAAALLAAAAAMAPAQEHWAYRPVRDPEPPPVQRVDWPRVDLDRFVLAAMERRGLSPSPEAGPAVLLRRVSLDLIGLPPSAEELQRFLADDEPGAWLRAVDRLLASPHFGERWARMWLDLARYADTKGYEKDARRSIWPYRDWVIDAFHRDLPFDRFTIEQLAGDLLPDPGVDQLVATAFHRNTMTNDEGGTDDEEFRVAAVNDRVATTFQVWMGTTMGCAQCHDHKFDPITQREYYEVFAFFNNTADADRPDEAPVIPVPAAAGPGDGEPPTVPILRELRGEQRRQTHVHLRGSFLAKGDPVQPGVPACFHPWPEGAPPDRLGLAQWLVDPRNPLTARVQANRFWEELFGAGLVRTSEDFGTQGEPPSHPDLLDHLASRFAGGGWSVKALLRYLVSSATYRQSSAVTPGLLAADPENRWLARGPAFRLSAEAVRDQALAIAGLLSERIGGPSVMPPQPEGVWQIVYSDDRWQTATGPDRYRRSLYTFWRRTSPHPAMVAFDAPSREFCVVRRLRTNTPLQALVTLNDPQFVEAAQALARAMAAAGEAPARRIRAGFARCLLRQPLPEELARLEALYRQQCRHFEADPEAAARLAAPLPGSVLPVPAPADCVPLAALTVVANVLLNLDEVLTKW